MYVKLDFSKLSKKEQKYLKKRKVEKILNEDLEQGAKCGFLIMKTPRFIAPYHIGRDIEESAKGQMRFEFYGFVRTKVHKKLTSLRIGYDGTENVNKAIYRWCLPGYELPTKR
ncbi:hypothetical protein IKF74_01785 [Candidatus Saccharibacteria bacterium]|nr:hypothetical protein [Candidatus Saccharibacteria bacterium]